LKNSIRVKIITVFVFLFVVLGTISIWSILNFRRLSDAIEAIMEANYQSVVSAQIMTVALERQDSAELASIFSTGDSASEIFTSNQNEFLKALSRAEDNITETKEPAILSELNELYADYVNEYYVLLAIAESRGIQEASSYYYNSILPLFENVKKLTRDLLTVNQEAMLSKRNRALEVARNASFSTALISSFAIFLGFIFSIYLTAKTVRPITMLIEKIKLIAQGDYRQQLQEKGRDEIAELSKEFNIMAGRLKAFEEMNIQKLMEEKRKAEGIVESIGDVVLVTDSENRILVLNRAAEKVFDIRKEEAVRTHFLESIRYEEVFEQVKKTLKGQQEGDKGYADVSIEENGSTRHFRVKSKPIKNEQKEIVGVVTLLQDITKLKEVDAMKSEFVSTVSHEFRTPLTSMGMAVNLLLDGTSGETNEEQKELLQAIKEDQERLNSLVGDLLDLSRIESGKIQMDIQPNELKEIVDNAMRPFTIQLKENDIDLRVELPDKLPRVKADFNKISWVLTNLVGNAIRYVSKDGSGKITVTARKTVNKLLVSVTDNGIGIPEDMQEKIFEKFVRADESPGGTGLGLAISREILLAHGGEIWVSSKQGSGSAFYFTLYCVG
jgi:PAS domain S-box-containing protein